MVVLIVQYSFVESAWNTIVYQVDEIIDMVLFSSPTGTCSLSGQELKNKTDSKCPIRIKPLDTMLNGRCYTVSTETYVNVQDYLEITFKRPLLEVMIRSVFHDLIDFLWLSRMGVLAKTL